MCSRPIEIARSFFEFCNLEWCEQTNDFLGLSTTKDTDSYYSVYKNPEKSANKWKQSLTQEQIESVKSVTSQSLLSEYYLDLK